MALHLNASNSLLRLAEKLSADLKDQRAHVFQPQYLVTQTEGMNNWLKLQIAGHLGIAANYRFLKPNDLVQEIFYMLDGKYTQMLTTANLTWLLFKLTGEEDFIRRFKTVSQYYDHGGPDNDLKRLALAEKTADLMDQYQVYRPDIIRAWNESTADLVDDDDWQQYLWIKAKEYLGNRFPDKTVVGQYILDSLKSPQSQATLADKVPAIHVFGLSITTAYHMQILYELSRYIDISYYILNPSPEIFWFDDKSEKQIAIWKDRGNGSIAEPSAGNALLTSWGRVIQDTFSLLFKQDEFLNAYAEIGVQPPGTESLLHKIQLDIFNNAANTERNRFLLSDITDGSITINACFTIAREVEVLYNYLVRLVDRKNESLSPRDIVVMVSDIDAYAPYIKAVFNHAPYPFKYTIADESFTATDNIFNSLVAVMEMNEQNFTAEEVVQLLDSGYIRGRFSISDLSLIRKTVNKANIRFGIEGKKDDDTIYVSWKYGIQRIMYGICMSGDEEYIIEGETLYPLNAPEGDDALELVRFSHFVQVLIHSIHERKRSRTIAEWVEYVERLLLNILYEPGEDVDEDYNRLISQLEKFNVLNEVLSDDIPFELFFHSLLQTIAGTTRSGTFGTGGITFCSLIPMRSIPFKVVALLGINFDQFPRKENAPSFSLMEKEKRKGDRNVKENDKHLFLETILSAQKYLYISYIGQSPKDNTIIPPSALVDELIDYIASGSVMPGRVKDVLVTLQPLHSFSRKYGSGDERLYNYLDENTEQEKVTVDINKEGKKFSFDEVSLRSMISFFKNPFKAYYNKVLGIYYNEDPVLLSDTELFETDKLQEWHAKQQLLLMDGEQAATLKRKLLKTGGLPLKNMSGLTMQAIESGVHPVREMLRTCIGEAEEKSLLVDLPIDNSVLNGRLDRIFDNKLVFISFSKIECKYLLEAYISYLAARAAGASLDLRFISGENRRIYHGTAISQADAIQRLAGLMQLYRQGHDSILAFSPDFDVTPKDIPFVDENNFKKMLGIKFDPYQKNPSANPGTNIYLTKMYVNGYFNQEGILDQYNSNCEKLLVPLAELFPTYYQ